MDLFDVYVPRPTSRLAVEVLPTSGMVGTVNADATVTVDFEGNRYRASNIVTWCDRLAFAAGRHAARYPTVARAHVDAGDVIVVGSYDDVNGVVTVDEVDLVAAWLGVDQLDAGELRSTAVRHAQRAEFIKAWREHPEMRPLLRREAARMHAADLI